MIEYEQTDSHFLIAQPSQNNPRIFRCKMQYPLDETHLFYLSIQLKSIMRQMLPPVEIIIVSDIVSELSDMSLFLNRKFSPDLITITPYLLNAQSPATLLHKENCIITNKKFKNII